VHVEELWRELAADLVELIATFRTRLPALNVSSKPDRTLLTDADTAAQELIVERIRLFDPHSPVIAEEDDGGARRADRATSSGHTWIVDPIDGTAQFVQPSAVEFCSVIALYEHGSPIAALVVAPELGPTRTPVVVSARTGARTGEITVNGQPQAVGQRALNGQASTTRSRDATPSPIERALAARSYRLKTRTTSQSLDLVRTALDITCYAAGMSPFDVFHRRQQKLWDGAAGFCLAQAAGLAISDEHGRPLLPLAAELLTSPEPILPSAVVGPATLVTTLVSRTGNA
jgi:3'(2'), 5'-bisphosphate nucleotidase